MRITDTENIRNNIEPETIEEINDFERHIFDRSRCENIIKSENLREMWVYVYVKPRLWHADGVQQVKRKIIVTYSTNFSSTTEQMDNITYAYEKYRKYKTKQWKDAFFDEVETYLLHYSKMANLSDTTFVVTTIYDVKMNIGI